MEQCASCDGPNDYYNEATPDKVDPKDHKEALLALKGINLDTQEIQEEEIATYRSQHKEEAENDKAMSSPIKQEQDQKVDQ